MNHLNSERPSWKSVLAQNDFLPLPAAHDALTARLIELGGFKAYQIGGFALVGAMHAVPDIDLEHFGEISDVVRNIIPASSLPVLVDGDDGYGDVKNVTRTVRGYEFLGASAIFLEDQQAPKRCGHMAGKTCIAPELMEAKIRAAVAAKRTSDFFVLARTDAIAPEGLDSALRRGERYLKAGADGVYFEGPTSVAELTQIGKEFRHVPLATSVLEKGGKTPYLSHSHFKQLGFNMVLYPSSIIFPIAKTIQTALKRVLHGQQLPANDCLDMDAFEQVMDMPYWKGIETRFQPPTK